MESTPLMNHWWNVHAVRDGAWSDDVADPACGPRLPDRLRLHRAAARHRRVGRRLSVDAACRGARSPTSTPSSWQHLDRPWPVDADLDDAGRDPGRDSVRSGHHARHLRRRPGATVLAGAGPDGPGVRGVPQPICRQGQPRAPVLGSARPCRHPVLRSARAASSGRGAPTAVRTSCTRPTRTRSAAPATGRDPTAKASSTRYAYPIPEGFADADLDVPGARYDKELGEFMLPYEAVRTAADPDQLLLSFLQASYDAAADLARWDRAGTRTSAADLAGVTPVRALIRSIRDRFAARVANRRRGRVIEMGDDSPPTSMTALGSCALPRVDMVPAALCGASGPLSPSDPPIDQGAAACTPIYANC